MNSQGPTREVKKIDLLVSIPGRKVPRFVPGITAQLKFAEVLQTVGDAWGVQDVANCALRSYHSASKHYDLVITGDAQWSYVLEKGPFRTVGERTEMLKFDFIRLSEPSDWE